VVGTGTGRGKRVSYTGTAGSSKNCKEPARLAGSSRWLVSLATHRATSAGQRASAASSSLTQLSLNFCNHHRRARRAPQATNLGDALHNALHRLLATGLVGSNLLLGQVPY
jgi:hypothetical protein